MKRIICLLIIFSIVLIGLNMNFNSSALAADAKIKVKFAFVIDTTGSMRSYINSVTNNLLAFSNYLKELNIDAKYSVIEFKDVTVKGEENSVIVHTWNDSEWTTDIASVEKTLRSIRVGGGGDDAETPTEALKKYPGDSEDGFSYAFLLTDADAKGKADDAKLWDLSDAAASYGAYGYGIHASVVSKRAYQKHYAELYEVTGGIFIDIDASDYLSLMLSVADWIVEEANDTDGDGLPDTWEENGVDIDGDGTIDLDLPAMGADPKKRDIFVEVDYMHRDETVFSTVFGWNITLESELTMLPAQSAFNTVMDQFLAHGIRLHIDVGPNSIMNPVTRETWGALSRSNTIEYNDNFDTTISNWLSFARKYFDRNRWHAFRYCLCVNKFNNGSSSGVSVSPGQFIIIADTKEGGSDGVFYDNRRAAGTFMHELGHSLGLHHGGDERTIYKPNYLSIMNYLYQFTGLVGTNETNYSEYKLPSLNPESINENNGLDPNNLTAGTGIGAKWLYRRFICANEKDTGSIAGSSIDFDKNNKIESNLSIDFGLEDYEGGMLKESINDWQHLLLKAGGVGGQGVGDDDLVLIPEGSSLEYEWSVDEAAALGLLGNPGDCIIKSITPEAFYSAVDEQSIIVEIENLFPSQTTTTLTVHSRLLENPYEEELTLSALETKTVTIPVKAKLDKGTATISCQLRNENGETFDINQDVTVYYGEPLNMKVGETLDISEDEKAGLVYKSQDSSIVSIRDSKITAKSIGTAIVEVYNSDGTLIGSIYIVVSSGKGTPVTGDVSHPELWLLFIVVGLAGMIQLNRRQTSKRQ